MHHLTSGDVVAYRGRVGVVWSKTTSTPSVLAVLPEASAPRHRADVRIGVIVLAPLPGELLVRPTRWHTLSDFDQAVKVGRLDADVMAQIRLALQREADARALEATYEVSGLVKAVVPSFRSGGRRVGAKMMG